jgi:hypothetical protein
VRGLATNAGVLVARFHLSRIVRSLKPFARTCRLCISIEWQSKGQHSICNPFLTASEPSIGLYKASSICKELKQIRGYNGN